LADGSEELYNIDSDVDEKINLAADVRMLPVLFECRDLLGRTLKKR
jgi:hypothetical protein